jgi:alkylation response protein AidB-like acyl-CoA dehydrogenase
VLKRVSAISLVVLVVFALLGIVSLAKLGTTGKVRRFLNRLAWGRLIFPRF